MSNGDGTHTRKETVNCSGGTTTCVEQANCKDRGGKYGKRMPQITPAQRNGRSPAPVTSRNGRAAAMSLLPRNPTPSATGSSQKKRRSGRPERRPAPVRPAITLRRRRSPPLAPADCPPPTPAAAPPTELWAANTPNAESPANRPPTSACGQASSAYAAAPAPRPPAR